MLDFEVFRRGAQDLRVGHATASALRVLADHRHGHRPPHGRQRGLQDVEVGVLQPVFGHAADLTLAAAAGRGIAAVVFARLDAADDHVGRAQLTNLLDRFAFRAFADRQHGDHGTDAQNRAQHGQQAAQLVQHQVPDGEFNDLPPHGSRSLRRGVDAARRGSWTTGVAAVDGWRLGAAEICSGAFSAGSASPPAGRWASSAMAMGFSTTRSPARTPSRICTALSFVRPSLTGRRSGAVGPAT